MQDVGLIPGLRRSPGEGNGNQLQYYCLGNLMDRGPQWATQSVGSQRVGYDLATKQQQKERRPNENRSFSVFVIFFFKSGKILETYHSNTSKSKTRNYVSCSLKHMRQQFLPTELHETLMVIGEWELIYKNMSQQFMSPTLPTGQDEPIQRHCK